VSDIGGLGKAITKKLARLDEGQRTAFFALHNIHGDKQDTALGIARTNILPLDAQATEGGLFLQACRITRLILTS
jgi:hypothetical protein